MRNIKTKLVHFFFNEVFKNLIFIFEQSEKTSVLAGGKVLIFEQSEKTSVLAKGKVFIFEQSEKTSVLAKGKVLIFEQSEKTRFSKRFLFY